MSDFSDRPFAAGSLVGLRAFDVDRLGRLVGPSMHEPFRPGENHARCWTAQGWNLPAGTESQRVTWGGSPRFTVPGVGVLGRGEMAERYADPTHVVGAESCSCGYYAYFDGGNDYATNGRVSALIEGYGVCTVGERGFRAAKAHLVALIRPPDEPVEASDAETVVTAESCPWWRRALTSWVLPGLASALLSAGVVLSLFDGDWLAAAVSSFWVLAILLTKLMQVRSERSARALRAATQQITVQLQVRTSGWSEQTEIDWDLIQRNYPDVPVYPTVEAALAEHPVTPPPDPTLADEDFWTRAVR